MKGFNAPLKSKDQLQNYTKEELIDMYFELAENNKKFIDIILKADIEEFEKIKNFYNIINIIMGDN